MTEQTHDYGVFSIGKALSVLWKECRCTAPEALIDWFASHAAAESGRQSFNLAEVMEGVGCLVSTDSDNIDGAGNFQDGNSVSALLFSLSSQVAVLGELASIGGEASYWLRHPGSREALAAAMEWGQS